MKKMLFAVALAAAATVAQAVEVGVTANRDYAGANRNGAGLTIGNKYGNFGVTAGFERSTVGTNDQNRWSLIGSHDTVKLGSVSVGPRAGVAYLDNQTGSNGFAAVVGVGATVPLTSTVTFAADFTRQYGQNRVQAFDGNRVTLGLRKSF